MLNVEDLSYHYPNGEGLTNISFTLDEGDHLAIIGESGCGKSTLLKSIYGLLNLDQGSIMWKGNNILGPAFNLVPGYKDFKYLSQEFDLMPFTTAEENIQKFLSRETPDKNQKRCNQLLSLFDLEEASHKLVKDLSGGQKQRVALAQALAKPPELLLLDEPFSHIDQFLKHKLRRKLFQFLKEEHITCIFATHDAEDVLPFSDLTMVLKLGQTEDFRATPQVYNLPKSIYSASLFGDINLLDTKVFRLDINASQIITYPHEIIIKEKAEWTASVKQCYFKGSHYLVELKHKSRFIYASYNNSIPIGEKVNFEPDAQQIKKRLFTN